jgi:hypothetical protein
MTPCAQGHLSYVGQGFRFRGTLRRTAVALAEAVSPARSRHPLLCVAYCLALLLGPFGAAAWAAPKTDVVHLKNGDRITCEIKKLERAKLTLSTDPMDTITIHWAEVEDLVSRRVFEVEVSSGMLHFGSLATGPTGQVTLVGSGGGTELLALTDIIRLTPIGSSFWGRMDGNIDFGFSFAQADLETHWTLNSSATYRSPRYRLKGSAASQLTVREDADRLSRNTVSAAANRFLARRWYTIIMGQVQQNEELSLQLRALGGAGFGRDFSQSNTRLVSGFGGLVVTRERFTGEPAESSVEATAGGTVDFFSPRNEDFTFSNDVVSYYNLGGRGRVRLELQSALRHKFLKDFYWSVNGFESFDSAPPQNQKGNDAGISVTLGWSF